MGCPKCGKPGYSVKANADLQTRADVLCREHWQEVQARRINQLFAMLESSPNIQHAFFDNGKWHYTDFALRDPGMLRGQQRRIIHKSEPMAG